MKQQPNIIDNNYGYQMDQKYTLPLKSTDRLLPIANISKIMKHPIPKMAKVARDAKELMQKSASEFICIVTCMAKQICESENRKTLTGDDLIRAMDQLGMNFYAEITKKYFLRYKDSGRTAKLLMTRGINRNEDEYGGLDGR
ncbi:Nuclear transcription factor Y subunit B-8 [Astathelohania contejeani]|uniref:Nuclear transcription factor Y subunit B-8 n=1 Tax=Astathelohania contejeani TaxID=164912 RepID=A0ABQ7HYL7_9MICR|nr:Nuclear transcription factor Y subunit B-8 [Thelohania contejeani]